MGELKFSISFKEYVSYDSYIDPHFTFSINQLYQCERLDYYFPS